MTAEITRRFNAHRSSDALVVLALAGGALMGRLVWLGVAGNIAFLRSWTRMPGVVRAMPERTYIEVEIGEGEDARRGI